MKIGLDVFGGDYAPEVAILGAIMAAKSLSPDISLVLIGDEEIINNICRRENFDSSVFEIVHTTEYIGMGDFPAKAFVQKQGSSIVKGFQLLSRKEIDGFTSAGNTGAMMVGATQVIKSVPGVIRPSISASVPRPHGKPLLLLDVGLNPDCRPDVLYQYGILGNIYASQVLGIDNPKVGLLNIGSEEEKGNLLTKATFQLMKDSHDFSFIGNIEGNDIFSDKADVMVCDGFTGNVMIKEAEAFYAALRKRALKDDFLEKFNFENHGGTPILGINDTVVIGHGISNDVAIKNMILHTISVVQGKFCENIKAFFK